MEAPTVSAAGAVPGVVTSLAAVASCSFLATSVFGLSGLVLRDPPATVPDLLQVVLIAVLWNVVLAPFVIPVVVRGLARLEPHRGTSGDIQPHTARRNPVKI